ncbi:hypothetical protein [Maribacter luteus]|uniref:hypothetical protein n=1 Tax=Maribacter luteus TaxID=2594478 RepID=UPI0024923869|nr:hypothetical protein [Maribacter luteus]
MVGGSGLFFSYRITVWVLFVATGSITYLALFFSKLTDENFLDKTKRTASEYANMLTIILKVLIRLTKVHFNKTLTDLIFERIKIEAKRELYSTNKTVKKLPMN